LDPDGTDRWRSPLAQAAESGYRLCHNDKIEGICTWALRADDDNPLCVSCRITRVIPNLADPAPAPRGIASRANRLNNDIY
jgi:hypothetical protein